MNPGSFSQKDILGNGAELQKRSTARSDRAIALLGLQRPLPRFRYHLVISPGNIVAERLESLELMPIAAY